MDVLAPLAQVGEGFFKKRTQTCESRDGFCPDWIAHHLGDYVSPTVRHIELVVVSLAIGFAIAFSLAVLAHRRRWLVAPITGVTGILYTIPALALFAILIPVTGFGFITGVIPLVAYSLLIIFRNVVTGLQSVPAEATDAARGMGMTPSQVLTRVELPLALPEIIAGLRIAATSTVALATLAFFAGAGGLGDKINRDINFKSNIVVAGLLCVALAVFFDLALLALQRLLAPWQRVRPA